MLSQVPFECPAYLLGKATSSQPVAIAVAGADGELALASVRLAHEAGLIIPTLVGGEARIRALADNMQWDIGDFRILPADNEHQCAAIAVALASRGEVATLMKGQVHTDTLMRAVLDRETGLRTGRRLSHLFHMTIPAREGSLLITDAAVNVAPNITTKLDIIRNAVDVLHALDVARPKVAVLSATEQVTPAMPSSLEAAEITERAAAGEIVDADVYGPLAMDIALSPAAAAVKDIAHPVAGHADIVLVPNIETGNAVYKALVYLMSACPAGLVMGARAPIILTSRADPPEARLASVALATIVARNQDG